jgi:rhodanese-related sulfurtransferase
MKASTSFVLRTLIIAGISVGLGLAFNATRPGGLPLDQTWEKPVRTAPAAEEATAPKPDGTEVLQHASDAMKAASNHTGEESATENASLAAPLDETANASLAVPEEPVEPEGALPAESVNATEPDSTDGANPADAVLAREISLQEAAQLFAAGQAVFVDARDEQSYAEGHVQGAVSLPLMTFPQGLSEIRETFEGMTIITYCDGERCPLSRELAEALRVEGVENVRELRNGWTLWQEQGLPTATEHGGGQS